MAVDGKAIITFGYLPTNSTQFIDRIMTFGWWEGIPAIISGADGQGNKISVKLIGQHKV